jgi:SpoVK/Ycf46/Vps4 family AAA+-type ATPase
MLAFAQQMFAARKRLAERTACSKRFAATLAQNAAGWDRFWHASFELSQSNLTCQRCLEAKLTPVEREIVVTLILLELGLLTLGTRTASEILGELHLSGVAVIKALRSLNEEGALMKRGFISCKNPEDTPGEQILYVDPALVDAVVNEGVVKTPGWPVKTEAELHVYLQRLTRALRRKADAASACDYDGVPEDFDKWSRQVDRHLQQLDETLKLHKDWRLAILREDRFSQNDAVILLTLLGKELGHVASDDELFTLGGLARAAADHPEGAKSLLQSIVENLRGRLSKWIQPCAGKSELFGGGSDDDEVEVELTLGALKELGIEKRLIKSRSGSLSVREAVVRLDQIVLGPRTRRALDMAITHARHASKLIEEWGLGKSFSYGRGVTLLFSGPPGTGKTASAEALAHELQKPILVADYSQVQNCFVGQTEKNIVKTFHTAKAHDAVLLWDEADAMFGDRDMAARSWEVRDANVLLQELERFEGICVLATNRKITLDAALERRITLKVEFERPDRNMRLEIWKKLLPKELPLSPGVDLSHLSDVDLSGGEVKNVILNACRLTLERNGQGPVSADDFKQAIGMELEGRWNEAGGRQIGFGH